MLTELRIQNFAIIQALELQFKAGLVIVTGETGAGKSILLDAIMALVGGRVDATMVRGGADRAVLEAVFTIPEFTRVEIVEILNREALDDGENTITLGREIRIEGRTVARINGRSVNVGLLKELGAFLVDIHGQAEHLSLLDVRSHLGLLDRFAGVEGELHEYRVDFEKLKQIRKELSTLRGLEAEASRKSELLKFQVEEISAASIKEGEEVELDVERTRLANTEALAASAQQALVLLDEGGPESQAVTDLLGEATQALNSLSRIDTSRQGLLDQTEEAAAQIGEVIRDLRSYLEEIEFNPRRLEQVENRLEFIHGLKRKYGGSVAAVLDYGKKAQEQLETITHAEEKIVELSEDEKIAMQKLAAAGELLTQRRHQAADSLARGVEIELDELSMKGAQFSVNFIHSPDPDGATLSSGQTVAFDQNGFDQVEFLIAPNPGEGLKPLVKIASGGETSRLMLALKNVLARVDFVPTLIFDEIDQGIGGRVGAVVGEKLWNLSREHQVMCVTHLPQLAAFGDQHYHVLKEINDGRTSTIVEDLDDNGRIVELAQMTGSITESNLNAAREMLVQARQRQKALLSS
ncbi:MAG: DNA repair protein RecN [Anaerolineaceae bacterium]